ncbi:hypothetical protein SK128_009083, partial [Halocaridina rubra]
IIWKRGDEALFLGNLDLGGVQGLSLSVKGELILAEGSIANIRSNVSYTCFTFDDVSFDDVEVVTYHIDLIGEETVVSVIDNVETDIDLPEETDSTSLQFDLGEEVAVLANSERVGKKLAEMCEQNARDSGDLAENESIFIGIDFFVQLMSDRRESASKTCSYYQTQYINIYVRFFTNT